MKIAIVVLFSIILFSSCVRRTATVHIISTGNDVLVNSNDFYYYNRGDTVLLRRIVGRDWDLVTDEPVQKDGFRRKEWVIGRDTGSSVIEERIGIVKEIN